MNGNHPDFSAMYKHPLLVSLAICAVLGLIEGLTIAVIMGATRPERIAR